AGTDSGTFDYFTEAINGKEDACRGDFTSSEDDNVLVQGVSSDENALGFFGLAYYEENKGRLKALAVDDENPANGAGAQIPTAQNVISGSYQPLSRPLFIYVRKDSLQRPEIKAFVKFYLDNAKSLVSEVGYVPLPDKVYTLAMQRFEKGLTGSIFSSGGSQVGVTLEELLSAEASKQG
ncbi:MAG: protein sphX, partial [Proteobacteria bacterium]